MPCVPFSLISISRLLEPKIGLENELLHVDDLNVAPFIIKCCLPRDKWLGTVSAKIRSHLLDLSLFVVCLLFLSPALLLAGAFVHHPLLLWGVVLRCH